MKNAKQGNSIKKVVILAIGYLCHFSVGRKWAITPKMNRFVAREMPPEVK